MAHETLTSPCPDRLLVLPSLACLFIAAVAAPLHHAFQASADFASVPGHVWGRRVAGDVWRGTCGGGRVAGDEPWNRRGRSHAHRAAKALPSGRRRITTRRHPRLGGSAGESRLAGAAASESRLVAARLGRVSACNAKARLTGRMTCQAYIAG